MGSVSVTNTFATGTKIFASQVNTNYSDIVNYINNRNSASSGWDSLSVTNNGAIGGTLTVTGATSLNSTLGVTGAASLSSTLVVTGASTLNGQVIAKGTATNDSASAGYIGEYVESNQTSLTNAGTSNTWTNLLSISLGAGDWDVSGHIILSQNGATVTSNTKMAESVNSGITTTDHVLGSNEMYVMNVTSSLPFLTTTISAYRISIASTTIVYLKTLVNYSVATPQVAGSIRARRAR